ncbi:MAG: phosphoenolpyruvate--protein phosphotransferase [Verrucomicrobiaceae bacterium]|nr:phosphoenolpyruvate--protein phosphotransferase [Verrucomicrobiaceae bacterium]
MPVSSGVAHAAVHVVRDHFDEPEETTIGPQEVETELARFRAAIESTRCEIEELKRIIEKESSEGSGNGEIFETHLLILEDASLLNQVERRVRTELVNVDAAYYGLMTKHMVALRGLSDPYLRERYLDIKDVRKRMMRHLRGEHRAETTFEHEVIIVAHDLTPSDTVQLDRSKVLGFAIETGSANSHAAIIAKSLGLPAVVRLHGICDVLHSGDSVLLDGHEGLMILNPTADTLARYRIREEQAERQEDMFLSRRHEPATTRDGKTIRIGANGEFLEELDIIKDSGAEEVGLFRTEFLYLENPEATEQMLAEAYTEIVWGLAPRLVVFRTLDLGGDKLDPLLAEEPEPNPFLGWRGIRVSLGRREFFKRQLRALLRAGAHGRVGVMFPMVSGVEEVRQSRELLLQCGEELRAQGVPVADEVEVGAMIEIPSAAMIADLIAGDVDFFSIGTNDLIQYSLAVDRVNERVADLYQPTHPALIRLIAHVMNASHEKGVPVGICGEMAADVALTPLLVGLGLDELSVAAGQVARVKHAVRLLDAAECKSLVRQARALSTAAEILELSRGHAMERYPELFA